MSKALAFLAGLGSGALSTWQKQREIDRQEKLDQITFDRADREKKVADREEQKQKDIANASQDVQVTDATGVTGLSTPGTETNYTDPALATADVRQSKSMAEATGTPAPDVNVAQKFAAGGTITASPGDASRAAAAQNTPAGKEARIVAALAKYDPLAAKHYESSSVQGKAAQLQLAEAQWKTDFGKAITGGWQGLVDFVNKNETGPMQGVQVQPIVSPDGKSVSFARMGPDGPQPIPGLQFGNDQQGLLQAAYMLDRTVTPGARLAHSLAVAKEGREQGKTDAEIKELTAKAGYWDANSDLKNVLSANGGSASKGGDKPFKMDEDDKMRVKDADTRVRDAERLVAENMGKLMPGDDPAKAPGVSYAQNMLRQARAENFKTKIEVGLLTPERVAQDTIAAATRPAEVLQSLQELANMVGTEFSDKVASKLQSNEAWKAMTNKPTATPAAAPKTAVGKAMAKAPPGSVRVVGDKVMPSGTATDDRAVMYQEEIVKAQRQLADATTPKDKAEAQRLIDALKRQLEGATGTTPVSSAARMAARGVGQLPQ